MASSLKKTRVVFQLPDVGSWFENIAVRASGTLLVTRVDVPEVWEVDPATGSGSLLATFPAPVGSITGITELTPDVFVVGAGQYNLGSGTVAGSYGVYLLDLSGGSPPSPKLVVQMPEVGLLNGLTTWDAETGAGGPTRSLAGCIGSTCLRASTPSSAATRPPWARPTRRPSRSASTASAWRPTGSSTSPTRCVRPSSA